MKIRIVVFASNNHEGTKVGFVVFRSNDHEGDTVVERANRTIRKHVARFVLVQPGLLLVYLFATAIFHKNISQAL